MASTVGHALCGMICLLGTKPARLSSAVTLSWFSVVLFMVLANLPDVDFLLGYLLVADPRAYHQGPTHTLAFALGVGSLVGVVSHARLRMGRWPAAAACVLVICSHLVVDLFTGPFPGLNPTPGIALLWPFSAAPWPAPVTLFLGIRHDSVAALIGPHNARAIIREILILAPLTALLLVCIRRNGRG